MMASVSLAGMSCRRADAAPDTMQSYMQSHDRFAGTRRTNLITIRALIAQCLRSSPRKNKTHRSAEKRFAIRHLKLHLRGAQRAADTPKTPSLDSVN
jgi:hypothetical protein